MIFATGSRSIRGVAKVKATKARIEVTMLEDNHLYVIAPENANMIPANGTWFVNLSSKGDRLYDYRPATGLFRVKTARFAAKPNQDPMPFTDPPRTVRNKQGQVFEAGGELMFNVILKFVDPDYKGMEQPLRLSYAFTPNAAGYALLENSRRQSVQLTARYLECCGVWGEEVQIPFSENVLPALEALILKKGREFMISVERGYVKSIALAPATPKRSAAKPARKPTAAAKSKATKKAAPKKAKKA